MAKTYESWKRVPTTSSALFGLELPYQPPKNHIGAFLWRKRIRLETAIGLSLLEPWEKILVLGIIYLTLTLVLTGLYKFVPQQVATLHSRLLYYFFGQAPNASSALHYHGVAGWLAGNSSGEL